MSLRAQQSQQIRTYMQAKQPLVKGLIAADDVAAAVAVSAERRRPVHYR